VPRGWEVAAACAFLAAAALAAPALSRRPRAGEPPWARAAAVHQRSLPGRVPQQTLDMMRQVTTQVTTGTRRGGARVYVAWCTEEEPAHYGACCAGGTLLIGGRLLVILGEHLAAGPAPLAAAVLAHERSHLTRWRPHAHALAAIAGSWGLIIAGWAAPWPAVLLPALALRLAATAAAWLTETSCDLGAARDTSPAAILAAIDYKQRTQDHARAQWPRWKRHTASLLTCLAGSQHPPAGIRRAAIRALAR
jgi:hypothetical protein